MYSPPRTGGSHICSIMSTQRRNKTQNQQRPNARSGPRGGSKQRTVFAPTAMNKSSRQTGSNSTRYRECERIGTVNGSIAFSNVLDIPCNPGLASSFPWLSGHAALYESYVVHSITYRYKNLKGTDTDGNILMSFDYDTLDSPPASAIAQSQSTVWIDGAPWRIFEMKVPTRRGKLFTRSSVVPGTDLKTYDFGRLHVSAEGCADESAHGYLEVEYNIELCDKQVGGSSAGLPAGTTALFSNSTNVGIVDYDDVLVFETEVTNPLGIVDLGISGFEMPLGKYYVTWVIHGTPIDTNTGFAVWIDELETDHTFLIQPASGTQRTTVSSVCLQTIVSINEAGQLLSLRPKFAGSTAPPAATFMWNGVGETNTVTIRPA